MNFAKSILLVLVALLAAGQAEAKPKKLSVSKKTTAKALKHKHAVKLNHTAERIPPRGPVSGNVYGRDGRIVPGGDGGFATLTNRIGGLNLSIKSDNIKSDIFRAKELGNDAKLFKVTPGGLEADALTAGEAKRIIKNLVPDAPSSQVDAIVDETKIAPLGGGYSVNVK